MILKNWNTVPSKNIRYEKHLVSYFIENGFVTQDLLNKIKDAIKRGKNIIVTGKAGDGKTTFLNILVDVLDENKLCIAKYDELFPRIETERFSSYLYETSKDDIPTPSIEKSEDEEDILADKDVIFIDLPQDYEGSYNTDIFTAAYMMRENNIPVIMTVPMSAHVNMSGLEKEEKSKAMEIAYICREQGKYRVFDPAFLLHNTEIVYLEDWKATLLSERT